MVRPLRLRRLEKKRGAKESTSHAGFEKQHVHRIFFSLCLSFFFESLSKWISHLQVESSPHDTLLRILMRRARIPFSDGATCVETKDLQSSRQTAEMTPRNSWNHPKTWLEERGHSRRGYQEVRIKTLRAHAEGHDVCRSDLSDPASNEGPLDLF